MDVLVYKGRFLGDAEAEVLGAWDVSPIEGRGILSIARISKMMVPGKWQNVRVNSLVQLERPYFKHLK